MTPDNYTIQEFFLEVGDGHQLYVHDWGNKKAKDPIIFLHGGPGSGCSDKHRQIFNPNHHRVIFFDQRGSGRSLPHGSLEHNTTDTLTGDISLIAEYFKFKQFVLKGGSWGSCLALAYAIKNPKRVKALVIDGIFTGSQREIDWIDKGEFRTFFPEAWDRYLNKTPKKHHDDPSAYHHKNIQKDDATAHKSAVAYADLERAPMSLDDRFEPADPITFDPTSMKIEMMYFANRCFMPDRHILSNARKLTMPVWIVQGRYDMVCPPITAYELNKALPNSHLIWTVAGHRGGERNKYDVIKTILLQFS